MDGDFSTEELVILKVSDSRYLIGYVDLIELVNEETKEINIYDFKTSSDFKKSDLEHHGRQLIVYGLAKSMEGFKIGKLAWIMLKYVTVQYDGYARANSKHKTRIKKIIRRGRFAKEMTPVVEKMLYEAGWDDLDVEITISEFNEKNSLEVLPQFIQDAITVKQYIHEYPFTEDLIQETLDYINEQADKFEELWDKPIEEWRPVEINGTNSFYCFNLCSHREHCPELQKYKLGMQLEEIDDEDLF